MDQFLSMDWLTAKETTYVLLAFIAVLLIYTVVLIHKYVKKIFLKNCGRMRRKR